MNTRIRAILALFLVSLFFITLIPDEASAIPYKLEGYLKDDLGNPITLANISISGEVYDMAIQDVIPKTYYRITDQHGYYVIYLPVDEPSGYFMGSTLTVVYTSGDEVTTNSVNIQGLSTWANLTYETPFSAGEFIKSPVGIILVVLVISVLMIGYFTSRPGKEDEDLDDKPERVERRRR